MQIQEAKNLISAAWHEFEQGISIQNIRTRPGWCAELWLNGASKLKKAEVVFWGDSRSKLNTMHNAALKIVKQLELGHVALATSLYASFKRDYEQLVKILPAS